MQASHDFSPRLPVYFVVDCSGSMLGTKIETVKVGINRVREVLSSDPRSASSVALCVIWFNDHADRTPLTPIRQFAPPPLQVIGKTKLGEALSLLNAALDADLVLPREETGSASTLPGDYRPLVFLLTDGKPDPEDHLPEQARWQAQAARLKSRPTMRPLHIVGLAIGDDAVIPVLYQIADDVLLVDDKLAQGLQDYFDWVPDVVFQGAETPASTSGRQAGPLPAPPATITHMGRRDQSNN